MTIPQYLPDFSSWLHTENENEFSNVNQLKLKVPIFCINSDTDSSALNWCFKLLSQIRLALLCFRTMTNNKLGIQI